MEKSCMAMRGNSKQKNEFCNLIGGHVWISTSTAMSEIPENKERKKGNNKLCVPITTMYHAKSKNSHGFIRSFKNLSVWKEIYHGGNRCIYQISGINYYLRQTS